jgi:hypothetical protein
MARVKIINLKNIAKFSMGSILMLGTIIITSDQSNHIAIFNSSVLAYMLASLIFSVSVFMLCLRHFQVTSGDGIVIRLIAIIGALFCFSIWVALVYPITILLT